MRTLSLLVVAAATALSATAHAMKPGLWEITSQTTGGGMPVKPPAMSEAQRQKMEAMGIKLPGAAGGGMGMVMQRCVTKEQAAKRQPPQADESQSRAQRCEQKDVKVSGNTTTWRIECTGERKMTGTGSITFQGEERYSGESTFTMPDAKGGPATMTQKYSGRWLSANCK